MWKSELSARHVLSWLVIRSARPICNSYYLRLEAYSHRNIIPITGWMYARTLTRIYAWAYHDRIVSVCNVENDSFHASASICRGILIAQTSLFNYTAVAITFPETRETLMNIFRLSCKRVNTFIFNHTSRDINSFLELIKIRK